MRVLIASFDLVFLKCANEPHSVSLLLFFVNRSEPPSINIFTIFIFLSGDITEV